MAQRDHIEDGVWTPDESLHRRSQGGRAPPPPLSPDGGCDRICDQASFSSSAEASNVQSFPKLPPGCHLNSVRHPVICFVNQVGGGGFTRPPLLERIASRPISDLNSPGRISLCKPPQDFTVNAPWSRMCANYAKTNTLLASMETTPTKRTPRKF